MANVNRYPGLHRGPIDHKSSSVINQISNGSIDMGSAVMLETTILPGELLPRVSQSSVTGDPKVYGIAVGGDVDGIYGNGFTSVDDSTRATNAAGQGVVIVTQGRCPARVSGLGAGGAVSIGDKLMQSSTTGVLEKPTMAGQQIIATALNDVANNAADIIAVDVQREGVFVP